MTDIEVSVLITTYNHEKFIAQCLDSLINQKTSFKYEVVIGEDCSTDNTRKIVVEYAKKYPEIIKPILYKTNQGTKKCPGKGNFTNTFYECKGKYIVHIESDDFLIDTNKLQVQYNYLETNKEASACFHNAEVIFEDNSALPYLMNDENQKQRIETSDFLQEKETWFMATASVMFRRKLIPKHFPNWFLNCKSGDIPLYCMLSDKGYIGYIPKIMSVYRKHAAGLSMTDIHLDATFIENRIFMYNSIDEYTNFKYHKLIKKILSGYYLNLADSFQYKNNSIKSIQSIYKSWQLNRENNLIFQFKNHGSTQGFYQKYLTLVRKLNKFIG